MAKHITKGKLGEEKAVVFLKEKGYKILNINWRFDHKEIDIIAEDENEIVIVEVKTRSTDYYGDPIESIDNKKQEFLIEASNEYLIQNNIDKEVRYDVVGIVLNNNNCKINHIKNAFYPNF